MASSHINWNFIASMKDVKGEWKNVCMPEGGTIYWGKLRINYRSVKSDEILLKNVPMGNDSGSIRAIEKGIGIRLRKNAERNVKAPSLATISDWIG